MTLVPNTDRRFFEQGDPRPIPGFAYAPAALPPVAGLRVAMFSGNYNCIRDGANKALNRLVAHLLERGAQVRVYSPTCPSPAFEPVGDLVSVRSVAIPRRPEYRLATGLPHETREDIRRFAPTVFHLSAPDVLGTRALGFARELRLPVVTSLHTRFETYFQYYNIGFVRPLAEWHLKRFYRNSDFVLAPNAPIARELERDGWSDQVRIWGRGVNRDIFNPGRRDLNWRRANGFGDEEAVVLFFGRLVFEKGLDVFEAAVDRLRARGYRVRPLVVGEGPAGRAFETRVGDALFTGHLEGEALARAVASADILLNPSVTEAFGNVNLEAMASGLAVVSADVASAQALIDHDRTGLLVSPSDPQAYADAAAALMSDPLRRAAIGRQAAEAAKAYDWPTVLEAVIDTYRAAGAVPATQSPGAELPLAAR